jgi:hypothetical protein
MILFGFDKKLPENVSLKTGLFHTGFPIVIRNHQLVFQELSRLIVISRDGFYTFHPEFVRGFEAPLCT